ncbi:CHASE2 domain-containing protein [Capilliphycus salinus ALCB114379]|uniref:CHASE2 domain-containing protein n=1 Tax=Capilliphycus salinus TaxID=2768948 RepID=UPI0039A42EC9
MINKLLRRLKRKWPDATEFSIVATSTLILTAVLLAVNHFGGFQSLELFVYDQMMRLRGSFSPDPRILIVGISEDDIRSFNRLPLSDEVIAQLLEKLLELEPSVIGLDLYRDIRYEPGYQQLVEQLKSPKIIAIKKLGDTEGVPPPPTVPPDRVGFNDLVLDPDNVVRRNLIFADAPEGTSFSFSLKLALNYLQAEGIQPKNDPDDRDRIRLGEAVFLPLQSNSGGYQNIDAQGYQILLNYRSESDVARIVSVSDVLNGSIEPDWVKDKIVLIGTTAPSGKDLFLTPYSPGKKTTPKTPGVVIHAQMISQILDAATGERPLFEFWPQWIEMVWISSWAAIGATLAWLSRHPLILVLGSPLLLGILFGLSLMLFLNAYWVPVVSPGFAFILTSAILISYRAFQAQRQQQVMMRLLGQNASPEVAQALWRSRDRLLADGKLPGQKLTATILFTDIRNFSTISEQMPPENLLEWLNEYLAMLTQSVHNHHGIINKFTGDGIMAAFGVPMARVSENQIARDAYSAVCCALEMGEQLQRLNQEWQPRGLPVIQMRVGIFTGPLVAGSLGGRDRLEYGLLGDSVNIASRLESCQKERQSSVCRILIAYQTLQYIQDKFEVESWGLLPLKGKQQMVDVYRVIRKY